MRICLNFQNLIHLFWTIVITLSIYVIYLIYCAATEYRSERKIKLKASLQFKESIRIKRLQHIRSIENRVAQQQQPQMTAELECSEESFSRGKQHQTTEPSTNLIQHYTSAVCVHDFDIECNDKAYRRPSKENPTFNFGPTASKMKNAGTSNKESVLSCVSKKCLNNCNYSVNSNADISMTDDDFD